MFDAEKYIAEYQALEHGAPRLRVMKKAYLAADEAKNDEWSFQFRYRCLHESTFGGDDVDAMVVFPEIVALYDNSEELQADDDCFYKLMWCFKYIIENAVDFYHISLEQIDGFFAEFKRRLEAHGKSLRTYYYMREKISQYTGNLLPAEEYGKYRSYPADDLKDCTACEASSDVRAALMLGHPEEARERSKPIFSGELRCANVPQNTYGAWIDYDIEHGDFGHAKKLARRLAPMVRHEMDQLGRIGSLMHLYAIVDRHAGVTVFRQNLRTFLACRNHSARFWFAAGAYRLFDHMQTDELMQILPEEFPLRREDDHYSVRELRDYFFNIAKELAEKFDARNGNTWISDELTREDPEYQEDAVDLIHGDTAQIPSAIAAVCTTLPDELTVASISKVLEEDGRFAVALSHTDPDEGMIALQIAEGGTEEIYQVMLVCQPVPPVQEFRPASPIADDVADAVTNAEGVVLCLLLFEEKKPDLALHFQLKLLNLLCPGAVAFLDYSRRKLLPAGWVTLEAHSDVPPLVDYLYNLQIHGTAEAEQIWITTEGLRCLGIREIEILDANKSNYPRFCDLLCFTAERTILRDELSDAHEPFRVLQKQDRTPVICTWVPVSEAYDDYPPEEGLAGSMPLRLEMLGDEVQAYNGNAVLYLYDGEAPDGTQKRKRLNTITDAEFDTFCYGSYLDSSRKIAALARERYGIFANLLDKASDNAYVCVRFEHEDEEYEVWVKAEKAEENLIKGVFAEDCVLGKAGTPYETAPSQLTDFSVRLDENLVIHPNTAYIALEIDM